MDVTFVARGLFQAGPAARTQRLHKKSMLYRHILPGLALAVSLGAQAATHEAAHHAAPAAKSATGAKPAPKKAVVKPALHREHKEKASPPTARKIAPAPAPVIPPEVVRRMTELENANRQLESRVEELGRQMSGLSQAHAELKRAHATPVTPAVQPASPVPIIGSLVASVFGGLFGFFGARLGRGMKFPAGPKAASKKPVQSKAQVAARMESSGERIEPVLL